MELDVEFLARLQFALTIMFHYIFPPINIGLGLFLVLFETAYLVTGNKIYENITRFWIKIFAACFSVGVATGIVMEFEFGTNWATYSRFVGDVFGSPLAAEGIFAFFLESGFLAILLFGWGRVKPWFHLFSTIMVALGSIMSAFWIVVANSWQQTPVAYEIVENAGMMRAVITDFWEMVFNPSSLVRFTHVIVGAFIQGSFLIMSVAAFYYLKNKYQHFAVKSFVISLFIALIASIAQLLVGHRHAEVVAEYQPAKLAGYEGLYETTAGAPLYIIGYSDPDTKETVGIKIPGMLSYLLYGDKNAEVRGLSEFPESDWPPVGMIFQTYHIMVGIGFVFIGLTLITIFYLFKGTLFRQKWLLRIYVVSVILPVIANQFGWVSAERGRQPWIVEGLLRTSDGISKSVTAEEVLISFILFVLVYILLFFVWAYILDKEIRHGPEGPEDTPVIGFKLRSLKMDFLKKR
jgi:cytochrome d ubiquinol oxidase subunit I